MNKVRGEFIESIKKHQPLIGLEITDAKIDKLADYYELVWEDNPLLHLVALCSPEEFATRHILESLTLLEYLPQNAAFADVGTGAGLPSIPCLLVREDLRAILIESKEKKTKFLEKAIKALLINERVNIVNRQFEETESGNFEYVACRALDKFMEKLPRLLKWSKSRKLLLFGSPNLKALLIKYRPEIREKLMPLSERRYLYIA
jgi:16S rRNA (guanine(527)-N(7))-methyltransferase RsmG